MLTAVAYLSAPARALAEHKAHASAGAIFEKSSAPTKRRFLALPTFTRFVEKQKHNRVRAVPYKQQMYVVRAGVLRRALRRRRKERAYLDLRHFVRRRRLPSGKSRSP